MKLLPVSRWDVWSSGRLASGNRIIPSKKSNAAENINSAAFSFPEHVCSCVIFLFYSFVFHKLIFQIKISLLFAPGCNLPFRRLVQIWEIAVCLISKVDLCHMSCVTIRKKLFVYAVSAHAVNLIGRIFFYFLPEVLRCCEPQLHPLP